MRSTSVFVPTFLCAVLVNSCYFIQSSDASVYLPQQQYQQQRSASTSNRFGLKSSSTENKNHKKARHELRWAVKQHRHANAAAASRVSRHGGVGSNHLAVAIPGYSVPEQVLVGGFLNFLSIYNIVITARILLSWFPQAQGIGLLQPVFAITDPYLNLFRNIIPPIFGLDLSPILAFLLLNAMTSATVALGADIPPNFVQDKTKNVFQTQKQIQKDTMKPRFAMFGIK